MEVGNETKQALSSRPGSPGGNFCPGIGRGLVAAANGLATGGYRSIPITLDGLLVGGFVPDDLEKLQTVSFTDAEEGKLQDGWLLRDAIVLYIPAEQLKPETQVLVTSSSRGKSAQLTWADVQDQANMVMFDLSNRGTLKLVSLLPELDHRDEWIQDVDKVEVTQP